ncbi:HNH endonuclease [Acetobacter estunensis]|uniref:HNH endonuclease n=1 Tax=Acetobacter estunensis TaxID=104097 RepID=UPI001C2DACBB|nr:HNH endonuclease [Acetobacter estunensis]
MNGVFDTRAGTTYDDEIVSKYHFPDRYLSAALDCLGSWILYREPRRNGGRSGYVAVAKVIAVEPDPARPGYSYARMEGYLEFDAVVPLEGPDGPFEERLRAVEPTRRGAALQGRSIRTISLADFGAIVRRGLDATLAPINARRLELDPIHVDQPTRNLLEAPPPDQARRIEQVLVNRRIRDAAFRRQVIDAYDGRCCVTGLRLINGGGKAEAQAAHIQAVADGGPDVVRNGIALSATVHWLFDRHLISLTDDLGLLVAHNRIPRELSSLFGRQMERIILPRDPAYHPHPVYVRRHRERFAG